MSECGEFNDSRQALPNGTILHEEACCFLSGVCNKVNNNGVVCIENVQMSPNEYNNGRRIDGLP